MPLRQYRLAWLTHCSACGNLPPILINRRARFTHPPVFPLNFCPHNKDSYNTKKDGREGRKEEESCALFTLQWSLVLQHTHISASQAAFDKGQGKCTDQSRIAATTHSSAISPVCVWIYSKLKQISNALEQSQVRTTSFENTYLVCIWRAIN